MAPHHRNKKRHVALPRKRLGIPDLSRVYVSQRGGFRSNLPKKTSRFLASVHSWADPVSGTAAKNSRCRLGRHAQLQMGGKPPTHSHLVQKGLQHGKEPKCI